MGFGNASLHRFPRPRALGLALTLGLCWGLGAQEVDGVLQGYQRNFVRSSIGIKLDVLKEAAALSNPGMGPLFEMGLRFALDNGSLLPRDTQLRDIAVFSVLMVQRLAYLPALDELLSLFQNYKDEAVRVPILGALGDLASGNTQVVSNLNTFLYNQNTIRQAGIQPDPATIQACVVALGKLGSGTSFPVLFSTYMANYSDAVTADAKRAMASLKGDYDGYLAEVIRKNPTKDKMAALRAAIDNPGFSEVVKGEAAETALIVALDFTGSEPAEQGANRELRELATRELGLRAISRASPLAVRSFAAANEDFQGGRGSKRALLESIACLGAMKTNEAAQCLTLQLQLLNAEMDSGRVPDEEVLKAIIENLGTLGDKVAFDHLLFVSYLAYSDSVKSAAREALKKLRL